MNKKKQEMVNGLPKIELETYFWCMVQAQVIALTNDRGVGGVVVWENLYFGVDILLLKGLLKHTLNMYFPGKIRGILRGGVGVWHPHSSANCTAVGKSRERREKGEGKRKKREEGKVKVGKPQNHILIPLD